MAADRAKTTLMISLIIFVMIAFILSVTTYLGFQQRSVQEEAATQAKAEAQKAREDLAAAKQAFETVREVLGTDKDTSDAIVAERNDLFDREFSQFDKDPKSLLRLVEWLDESRTKHDEKVKRIEADAAAKADALEKKVAEAAALQAKAQQEAKAAKDELQQVSDDFKARWAQHEQAQATMKTEQDRALGESERLQAITAEIEKLGPLLSPDLRRKFAVEPAANQPVPWPERVRFVNAELRAREKAIKELNATLAALRVADPALQAMVRDATPDDERIDGFDGRITSVNAFDRTVLIICDSTAGMRPGLMLSVFDPDDPRPRLGTRKAVVEVADVEGPTLARARIRRDSTTEPILSGDGVATSLWSPGVTPEVAIVGFVRFGAGRAQDRAALKAIVERNGGRVVDSVTPTTALIVDGGVPQSDDVALGLDKDWKVDEAVRRKSLERAAELGIRTTSLDGLLDLLGLDREALDGRRLPYELGSAP